MQKTVKEIIEMIDNGTLHYNQSTQRKFIYADTPAQLACGMTTKSGSLINAILEEHIQLPAVYFWYNTDTDQLNIHDGKQRLLSLYYFIKPTAKINISTIRNGKATSWDGLSSNDQDYLLNYTFDIVERAGNSEEEERSFFLINTNSINLTSYECLSGMFYGQWLTDFETYIDSLSNIYTNVKAIGRGEQAYKFLFAVFNLANPKRKEQNSNIDSNLNIAIRTVRDQMFDATKYSFDKIIICFNELVDIIKGFKEDRAISVANFIIRQGYDKDTVLDYYRQCSRIRNDIVTWDLDTHKEFIEAFINGLKLDPQRYFTKVDKDVLYAKSPRCAHIDIDGTRCSITSYSALEVDHIEPWSKGGPTTIDNAQLLCKSHNSSKGNR